MCFFINVERLFYIAHHVRVADVEAEADVVEVRDVYKLHEALGRREFVGNIL